VRFTRSRCTPSAFGLVTPAVDGLWGRVVTAVLATAIAALTISVLFGPAGLTRLLRLQAERQALGEVAVAQLQRNQRLHEDLGRLQHDVRHLEATARRELGLVRPNEFVYRFKDAPGSAPRR